MIDSDRVYSYFEDHHGPLTPSTNGWYEGVCPYCGSRKLYLQPEKKQVKCYKGCIPSQFVVYFIKDYYGETVFNSYQILEEYETKLRIMPQAAIKPLKEEYILPEGYKSILDGRTPIGDRARRHLQNRGFDLNYLDMLGVGYASIGDFMGYIIIPFRKNGDIVYFIGRDFMGNYPRYKNPAASEYGVGKSEVLFNEEALYMNDKIYLVEGWSDAATLGSQGVSYQGSILGHIQASIIINSPVKEVVIVADGFYYREALKGAESLYKHKKVKVLNLDPYSTEEAKDVNALGADLIYNIEKETLYINNLKDFYDAARSVDSPKKEFFGGDAKRVRLLK